MEVRTQQEKVYPVDIARDGVGLRAFFARQGMTAVGGPPERLGALVKRELERWARVVSAAGIKAD